VRTPPIFLSKANLQHLIASITQPAEFGGKRKGLGEEFQGGENGKGLFA
jgi:hypothetical protein